MKTVSDFEGKDLMPGDTVVFFSAPAHLLKGIVTSVNEVSRILTLVIVVVTTPDGQTTTHRVLPDLCAKIA